MSYVTAVQIFKEEWNEMHENPVCISKDVLLHSMLHQMYECPLLKQVKHINVRSSDSSCMFVFLFVTGK
jgi:hypothetical protein